MKIALILLLTSLTTWAKPIPIQLGGYEFPPYVINRGGTYEGLTLDLIALLNQKQNKYVFSFVPTTTYRRYHDLKSSRYQIMAFESKTWGWTPGTVESSKIFRHGAEVFVAHKDKAKNQSYFDDLHNKTIKCMQGYHYGFLGFSTSSAALKGFNVEFTNTLDGNIRSVVMKRADIAMVTKEYLDIYLKTHPEERAKLMVSTKYDQLYDLGILVSKEQKAISVAEVNRLIDIIIHDGSWSALLKEKGIEEFRD
ncbi:transporter substrate-binding domain-containing protein [Bdellovibrio bacteriovorus]|uniref:substrate-binding periplasmic protein n=1 Tax=Bdellovibrio bacteriovorus TaxID=959 RepID=UPI0021D16249|nr:transporter substrate-binding domain-containing protein [Bdellovibrio bacteriovorus]UXR65515.1 transporter substrate-binding domain-containing protein [Bdellovibrio bacteriovorus]